MSVKVEVWGDYACFSRPELKTERMSYDEDETAARKERIYEERKKRAFQEIYDRFSNTISVSYSSGLWDSLDLTSEFEKNDADFFEIYAEYAIK